MGDTHEITEVTINFSSEMSASVRTDDLRSFSVTKKHQIESTSSIDGSITCTWDGHEESTIGKRYILTMLDSYSRFFMAIPCARDRAIDAARGLYLMFLRHRERPQIVSSDRGTHFTGEVYRNFCDFMGITH